MKHSVFLRTRLRSNRGYEHDWGYRWRVVEHFLCHQESSQQIHSKRADSYWTRQNPHHSPRVWRSSRLYYSSWQICTKSPSGVFDSAFCLIVQYSSLGFCCRRTAASWGECKSREQSGIKKTDIHFSLRWNGWSRDASARATRFKSNDQTYNKCNKWPCGQSADLPALTRSLLI